MAFICKLQNCNRSFPSDRSLYWHQIRDRNHNPEKSYENYAGNKRHSIVYENKNVNGSHSPHKKNSHLVHNILIWMK